MPHRGKASVESMTGGVQIVDGPKRDGPGGRRDNHGVMLKVVSISIAGSDQEG
jgi:hypothetical protein